MDRVDDDMRPHAGAVFADPPAFLLEAPLAGCRPKRTRWKAGLAILLGVEAGEVVPDDLLFGVALEPLSATVPTRHGPFGIEQVDGVVGDGLNQQTKAPLIRL